VFRKLGSRIYVVDAGIGFVTTFIEEAQAMVTLHRVWSLNFGLRSDQVSVAISFRW